MNALLSAELLKSRTTRAMWVALPIVVVLSAVIPAVNGSLAGTGDVPALTAGTLLDVVRGPVQLAGAAVLLLGLFSSAGEFRHRTVVLSRLAAPRPGPVLLAKLAAIGLLGLAVGLLVDVVSLTAGATVLHSHDVPVHLSANGVPYALAVVPLAAAVYGILGVAVGSLVRSTAGAVGVVLTWAFVIEGVLPVLTRSPHLADRLPSAAIKAVVDHHPGSAFLVLVYAGVLVLAAAVMDATREIA